MEVSSRCWCTRLQTAASARCSSLSTPGRVATLRRAGEVVYARWCIEKDWHFIHPHFRGPNRSPDACGSEKAVQDIIDAVEYMKQHHKVDPDRIYLVGVSGGGYASLLMAGRAPHLGAGVSAWVPISDVRAWWQPKDQGGPPKNARDIEKAVGGRPDQNSRAVQECVKRSAITYLHKASGVNLDINAGVADGHKGGEVFPLPIHFMRLIASCPRRIGSTTVSSKHSMKNRRFRRGWRRRSRGRPSLRHSRPHGREGS